MDATLRKQSPRLDTQLFDEPYNFEYAQAIKLLELLSPEKATLGSTAFSSKEAVRIRSNIQMSLPPSDLLSLERNLHPDHLPTLTINFIGIAGQTGPLPNVFSEVISDRVRHGDTAFRDFLDIFNHRLACIHYRIQVKFNLTLSHHHPQNSMAGKALLALSGLSHTSATREGLPRRVYLKYAGLLWQKPTSATSLEVFLSDLFGLEIHVEQFVGKWYEIESQIRTRIGPRFGDPKKTAIKNRLGIDAALGVKTWLNMENIRIHLHSLSIHTYKEMLPGFRLNTLITDATRNFLGREREFDFKLHLKAGEEYAAILDGTCALGMTTWLAGASRNMIPEAIVVPPSHSLDSKKISSKSLQD